MNPKIGWTEVGVASWYGPPYHGRKTANGETYDMEKMTAAHKRLPFNTWLRVRNLDNSRTTQVRINDRGPFVGKRIIDLSKAAARDIGMIGPGTARVRLTVIRPPKGGRRQAQGSSAARLGATPSPGGGFVVQIGAFGDRENAERLRQRAESRGFAATVKEFLQGGASWYHVVVEGGSHSKADSVLRNLQSQGFQGFVRPRLES